MKHLYRFLGGGLAYLLVEIVWRYLMGHGEASFLMAPMGGTVCVVLFLLDDKKWFPLLSSLAGAVTVTLLELVVGSIAVFRFGVRLWHYGRITWQGIIALDWFFIWWGLCLGVVVLRRLLGYFLKRWREKNGKAV